MPPTKLPAMLFMGSCSRTLQAEAERLQQQTAVVIILIKARRQRRGACSAAHLFIAVRQASASVVTSNGWCK